MFPDQDDCDLLDMDDAFDDKDFVDPTDEASSCGGQMIGVCLRNLVYMLSGLSGRFRSGGVGRV